MKIKDLVLVAILGALNLVVSMIVTFALFPLGPYAHCISPGIAGLFAGTVFVFMCNKVGKKGSFFAVFRCLFDCNGWRRILPSVDYFIYGFLYYRRSYTFIYGLSK